MNASYENKPASGFSLGKRRTRGDVVFDTCLYVFSVIMLIVVLYPLYFVVLASFSRPADVAMGKVWLWPTGFTLDGYEKIFEYARLWVGYRNTIFYTVAGTAIHLLVTIPAAYMLSRRELMFRNAVMIFFTVTMFVSGGMIPIYLTLQSYRLLDTVWVMILPGCVSVYNMIIARTFFQSNIPQELIDAAKIDGCSNFRTFTTIALPLSKAIIAVIALYCAVGQWNNYFSGLIYLRSDSLVPLQIVLRDILIMNSMDGTRTLTSSMESQVRLQELIKYGIIVVSSAPIMMVYPFLQKYFAQGVMIGAIKG